MLPLLEFAADGDEHTLRDAIGLLADHFGLTSEEREEILSSGLQRTFDNRVGWARTYLKHAGLLDSLRRGCFKTTEQGLAIPAEKSQKKNGMKFLENVESIRKFRQRNRLKKQHEPTTPEEQLEKDYGRLRHELAAELLSTVKKSPPEIKSNIILIDSEQLVDCMIDYGVGMMPIAS